MPISVTAVYPSRLTILWAVHRTAAAVLYCEHY